MVSHRQLATLLDKGVIERRHSAAFALVGTAPSFHHDLLAACVGVEPMAIASHRSACRLWGLRTADDEIEVSVRYPRDPTLTGVVVHRSRDLTLSDISWIGPIPVTNPARTLCDAGLIFPPTEVRRMVHHAVAAGLVTSQDLVRFRQQVGRQGRTGVVALDAIVDELPSCAEEMDSGPEVDLLVLCREFGLPEPVPQALVVVGGRQTRIDLAYPQQLVALEYDGFDPHSQPGQFVLDRRRQNDLVLEGWTVLRFTKADLSDHRAQTALVIRRALGHHRVL